MIHKHFTNVLVMCFNLFISFHFILSTKVYNNNFNDCHLTT